MSRDAIQFVEIDIPVCSRTYGVAPCTAAVGVTGDAKCFNTLATCQDAANYAASTVTLRFVGDAGYRPLDIEALPLLRGVSFNPAVLRPGVDLGDRATLTVTLADVPHGDAGPGFDPYQTTRGYDPYGQGTLFGRFRARQPYLRDAEMRWYQGYVGQALADMECRTSVVRATDGPSVDGVYTVTGIDPLAMLNGDRAQAPAVNTGRLNADITNVATSATLTPAGIGNTEYAASGYVAMGGEVAGFTRADDTLTLTVRGALGTVAEAHSATDRVQQVLRYAAADPADIIRDLMVTYAGVPAGYIPLAEWQAETAAYLRRNYTGTIGEPLPVAQLVAELMAEAGLSVWWDDLAAQLRLRVLRALPEDAQQFDATNMLDGTFGRQEQPDSRVSQVRVFYGRANPLTNSDQSDNYRQVRVVVDLDNEANYGSAAIREVWSRWIPAGGSTAAQRVGDLLIGRYGTPPRRFTFAVMRDSVSPNPRLGNLHSLAWRTEQNADGSEETVPVQIVRLNASLTRFDLEAEEMRYESLDSGDLDNRVITIDFDMQDANLRTLHDAQYPAPVGGETVTLIIAAGVVVGSSSASVPALDIGSWPGGVTINVIVAGTLQGKGGDGGDGADGAGDIVGEAGEAGGTALYTREAISLTDEDGAIWGGGGGGGGGGTGKTNNDHKGGGGGGGRGDTPGTGGVGPGAGGEGTAGTRDAAGSGGPGHTATGFFASPTTDYVRAGGNGGDAGAAGSNGYSGALAGGSGGAAGKAIDGVSYVTTVGPAGDRRGGQVN